MGSCSGPCSCACPPAGLPDSASLAPGNPYAGKSGPSACPPGQIRMRFLAGTCPEQAQGALRSTNGGWIPACLVSCFNPFGAGPLRTAAAKAAAELMAAAYCVSYRMPVIITRSNNVYGPGQFPEKLGEVQWQWDGAVCFDNMPRTSLGAQGQARLHTSHKRLGVGAAADKARLRMVVGSPPFAVGQGTAPAGSWQTRACALNRRPLWMHLAIAVPRTTLYCLPRLV